MALSAVAATLLGLLSGSEPRKPAATWHSEFVQWQHGAEALPWERVLKLPHGGAKPYRVALQPLWAVEGGIVAIEITVAWPSEPFDNLLGERKNDVPSPFVLTVEELDAGLDTSLFGSTRTFVLPRPARGVLRVSVLGSELGHGVGMCPTCRNIQALTARVEIEERSR
jgi:hypothetical protein